MKARFNSQFDPVTRSVCRLAMGVVAAALASNAGASSLEEIPAVNLRLSCGSVASTLRLFPSDSGVEPTDWVLSTSDGRRERFSLTELPTLRISHHLMWDDGRRVTKLQAARCEPSGASESNDVMACKPVEAAILLTEEPKSGWCKRSPSGSRKLRLLRVTSDIGGEILRRHIEGETVEVSPGASEPEPEYRYRHPMLDLDPPM